MNQNKPENFGTYSLPDFGQKLMKIAQGFPATWMGRRGALAMRKIVSKLYKKDVIDAEVEGVRVRCHMNDNVSERKFLFTPQFFDVDERKLISAELPRDGIFLDIGANAGLYTLWASKHLGDDGKCISIEPNPAVRRRLQENLALNGFTERVKIIPFGVSDAAGHFTLYLDEKNLGGSSIVKTHDKKSSAIDVKCYPLADILNDCQIDKLDILKIDIEGAEAKVLRPFFDTVDASLYPGHMIIENSQDVRESGLIDYLMADKGYRLVKTTRMNFILSKV